MIKCTSCKSSNAVIILTSIQCPNPKCNFYDEAWAKEIVKKKSDKRLKTMKRVACAARREKNNIHSMPW